MSDPSDPRETGAGREREEMKKQKYVGRLESFTSMVGDYPGKNSELN